MKKFVQFINENINFGSLTTKDLVFKITKYHLEDSGVKYSYFPIESWKSGKVYISVFIKDIRASQFQIEATGDVYDAATHGNVDDPNRVKWWKPENVENILKNKNQFKNSIYFEGGFGVEKKYRGKGIEKLIIKKIFEDYPQYKSIFLYAMTTEAKNFWINGLKGTPILGHKDTEPFVGNGVYLIRLDRDKII